MSWLFKSLQSDDPSLSDSPSNRGGGVKEDLSVIGESIGRQLRGVATFLAPPSTADDKPQFSDSSSFPSPSQSQALVGVRNDLAEIGGCLKTGLSLLSSNRAVAEISELTSSILQFQSNDNRGRHADEEDDSDYGDEYDDDYSPGITDEVMNFVEEIALRPECWTDFPLSLETDFKMSDVQREHASIVEHMVPSLTELRENLHSYMGNEQFWLIYFILVLPRMDEEDREILSSPVIVETRSLLLEKLQKTRNTKEQTSDTSQQNSSDEVSEIVNEAQKLGIEDDESKKLGHEDDVSFSDLEDDDNDLTARNSRSGQVQGFARTPSPSGSSDWVQLNEAQANVHKARPEKDSDAESSDWLKVDDSD